MTAALHASFVANRAETRFTVFAGELNGHLPSTVEETTFPDSVPTSIYFGLPDTCEPVPEGGVLRFRYRQEQVIPEDNVAHALSPDQQGNLELKLYAEGDHSKNRKLCLAGLTFGQVTEMLATPEGMDQLAALEGGAEFSREVLNLFGGPGVTPFHMVQADRRQFSVDRPDLSARVTCDTDTTFWRLGSRSLPGLVYAVRSATLPFRILEIKSETTVDPDGPEAKEIVTGLFGAQAVYKWVARVKRMAAKELCDGLGAPALHCPEFKETADDRYFYERELKIDVVDDPRETVVALPRRPMPGVYVHRVFPSDTRFRIHTYSDGTEVIEKADDDTFTGSFFQFKQDIESGDDGQLIRHEFGARSPAALWAKVGRAALEGEPTTTATATRHRVSRPVVCERTGNVFVFLADHCTATDGRMPLDQVEIEYIGTLGFSHNLGNPTPESITSDFAMLRQLAVDTIGSDKVLPRATTKQAWLTAG